jgi:hypothetical protein
VNEKSFSHADEEHNALLAYPLLAYHANGVRKLNLTQHMFD